MSIRMMVLSLVAFSLVALPIGSIAQPSQQGGQNDHKRMWAQLNLTDDQKAKLKELRIASKQTRQEYFAKVKALRRKSTEELLKDKPSSAVLYGYAKEIGDLDQGFAQKRVDHLLKVKQILNADQFARLVNSQDTDGERWNHQGAQNSNDNGPHSSQ